MRAHPDENLKVVGAASRCFELSLRRMTDAGLKALLDCQHPCFKKVASFFEARIIRRVMSVLCLKLFESTKEMK